MDKKKCGLIILLISVIFFLNSFVVSSQIYALDSPRTLVGSDDLNYEYMNENRFFKVYYGSDPSSGNVVKFSSEGVEMSLLPMALNWNNDYSQLEQISMPQPVSPILSSDKQDIIYPNAYGSGIDLVYVTQKDKVKEKLIINSFSDLPPPSQYVIDGGNPMIELGFQIGTNAQHIEIDGQDWDKKSDMTTTSEVVIKDDYGNILYTLPRPFAVDDEGKIVYGKYLFKASAGKLYVRIQIPYSWLSDSSTVYPITIDPTFVVSYSPVPAELLIDGEVFTDPDSAFGQSIDITTNMSDNNTDTKVRIVPKRRSVFINGTQSNSESSVSSTTYTDKINWDFEEFNGGYKLLTISGEVRSPNKRGVKVRYKLNDVVYGESVAEPKNAGDVIPIAFHKIIYLNPNTYNFQVEFANAENTDTVYMRRTVLSLADIYENYFDDEIDEQTLSTSFGDKEYVQFTPDNIGNYVVVGSGAITSKEDNEWAEAKLVINGQTFNSYKAEATDKEPTRDYRTFMWFQPMYFDTVQNNISIQARSQTGKGGIKNVHLSAIYVDDVEDKFFNYSLPISTHTSNVYQEKTRLTFQPDVTSDWEIYVTGDMTSADSNVPVHAKVEVDGLIVCEQVISNDVVTDGWFNFGCQVRQSFSGGVDHDVVIEFKAGTSGTSVSMKNVNILAIKSKNEGKPVKTISTRFSKTYDSAYDWFYRLYKSSSEASEITIQAYSTDDDVHSLNETKILTGTGYYEIPVDNLMDYMLNTAGLNHSRFRISSNEKTDISEVRLRQLVNDTIPPSINGCEIVESSITCLESLEFHCENITDDTEIDKVFFEINGMNYTPIRQHEHYSYYIEPDFDGTIDYNFSNAYAYDITGNKASQLVSDTATYTCDFDEYINITHNPDTQQLNISSNSVKIKWTTNNPSKSYVFWGKSPASLNNTDFSSAYVTDHEIYVDGLEGSTTYYYDLFSTINPNQTVGTFNFTTTSGCIEDWDEDTVNCRINDTYIRTYTDLNSCGTYDDLPADNGTEQYCNYCSEDLDKITGDCHPDNLRNVSYVDNNYYSCCDVTGLDSDCSVDVLYPYNETTTESCSYYFQDMGVPDCQEQFDFGVNEKEYCIVRIPLNFSNETFKCVSFVDNDDGEILQTNPQYREKTDGLFDFWRGEPESREYFSPANSIVNFYITKKNINPDTNYYLHILCSSNQRELESVHEFQVGYENLDFVFYRGRWAITNTQYMVAGFFIILIAGLVVLLLLGAFRR